MNSRTSQTIRNSIYGILLQLLIILFAFCTRKWYVEVLGLEIIGYSSLFEQMLSFLTIGDLGISSVLAIYLYKPVETNNTQETAAVIALLKKINLIIGTGMLIAGLVIIVFIRSFTKEVYESSIHYVQLIFFFLLLNSLCGYLFNSRVLFLHANQRIDIQYKATILMQIGVLIAKLILVLVFKNYLSFLIAQLIISILGYAAMAKYVNKIAPYLKQYCHVKIDQETRKDLTKNITQMMTYTMSSKIVGYTSNLIISKFFGVVLLGYLSNYRALITQIEQVIEKVLSPISLAAGSYSSVKTPDEIEKLLYKIDFFNFVFVGAATLFTVGTINNIIVLQMGKEYLFDFFPVLMCILLFFYSYMHSNLNSVFMVTKSYQKKSWIPIADIVINFTGCFILMKHWGIAGVFAGNIIYSIFFDFSRSWCLYHKIFQKSCKKYWLRKAEYFLLITIDSFGIWLFMKGFSFQNVFLDLIVKLLVCGLIEMISVFLFYKTFEFKAAILLLQEFLGKVKRKKA